MFSIVSFLLTIVFWANNLFIFCSLCYLFLLVILNIGIYCNYCICISTDFPCFNTFLFFGRQCICIFYGIIFCIISDCFLLTFSLIFARYSRSSDIINYWLHYIAATMGEYFLLLSFIYYSHLYILGEIFFWIHKWISVKSLLDIHNYNTCCYQHKFSTK